MAVYEEVLASVGKAVASGAALDHQVQVRAAGTLDGLRAALRPVFAEHGGRILARMPGVNALVITDVSIETLKALATLPEVQDVKPSYFLGSPC